MKQRECHMTLQLFTSYLLLNSTLERLTSAHRSNLAVCCFQAQDGFPGCSTHATRSSLWVCAVSCRRLPLILVLAWVQQQSVSSAPEAYEALITLHPHHVSVRAPDGNYYTLQITHETRWPHECWRF